MRCGRELVSKGGRIVVGASSSFLSISSGGKSDISSIVCTIVISAPSSVVHLGSPLLSPVCRGILRESALTRALSANTMGRSNGE